MKKRRFGRNFIVLEAKMALLTSWENFYVIIGTAAATLIGLMFVAITININLRRQGSSEAQGAFSTPTVIHFCIALLIAVLFSAPWSGLQIPSLLLGLIGLGGTLYIVLILRRFTRLNGYKPVLEDWAWHVIIPFVCYIMLFVVAFVLLSNPVLAMFFIGAVLVVFLFIGIHNAWDIVTYLTIEIIRQEINAPSTTSTEEKQLEETKSQP
jgi:hypothetical protein